MGSRHLKNAAVAGILQPSSRKSRPTACRPPRLNFSCLAALIFAVFSVKISAVIITLNEAAALPRCLASLAGVADEVVVVDSFSTDETAAVAEAAGARVQAHTFDGYGPQKRRAVSLASHDWILSLDADEELSPDLRASIMAIKTHGGGAQAYAFNRLTFYCGHPVRHGGWYPDRLVRLWHRDAGNISDSPVHESWEAAPGAGSTGFLRGDLHHHSFPHFGVHARKLVHYSEAGAQADFARGKRAGWVKILVGPLWVFVRMYFLKAGFVDGWAGYTIARASAVAAWMKYTRLMDLQRTASLAT